jgi:hypothetical protein
MKKTYVLAVCVAVIGSLLSCSKNNTTAVEGQDGAISESAFDSVMSGLSGKVPAVNLLDKVSVWPVNDEGTDLADKPFEEVLDIGSAITFNGKEQKYGKKQFVYAHISTEKGTDGWISAYRVAENAIPVVVVQDTFLYSMPNDASTTSVKVRAGQIGGAYIDAGRINGFVKVSYCVYYGPQNYSDRYDGFIKSEYVSGSKSDIECAQYMVRAVETPSQWGDFAEFALESESVLVRGVSNLPANAVAVPFDGKTLPDESAVSQGIAFESAPSVVAAPVVAGGSFVPWYAVSVNKKAYIVKLDPKEGASVNKLAGSLSLNLANKSVMGNSTVLMQDLAIKKQNDDDASKLDWIGSLNLGEVVSSTGKEMERDKVTYVEITRCDGTKGWANKTFICVESFPAAVDANGEAKLFKEPKKLSVMNGKTVSKYQIVAVNKDVSSQEWYSVSYYDEKAKRLMAEVYIPNDDEVKLVTGKQLNAALLLGKLKASESGKFKSEQSKKEYQECLATLIDSQSNGYVDHAEYEKYLPAAPIAQPAAETIDAGDSDAVIPSVSDSNSSDDVVVTTETAE